VQFLWPLYLFRRDGKDITIRIFPLYTYWRDVYEYRAGTEINTEYMLFPIVFGGTTTEAGSYFAVFPVGGELKHFLGRDEIHFILFPLYLSWKKGELRQRNYLWPVLSFSGGGGYSGFRLWPLYGFFEKENEFRSEFIGWPIYNHQEYDLDQEQPGERLLVFPFYAREDNTRRTYRAVLWPFFTYENNRARNFVERGMPWPFVVIARGDIERTQYWPLYGRRKAGDTETTFIAWPFWSRRSETANGIQEREMKLLPVYDAKTRLSEEDDVLYHKVRAWPLWRFRRYEDGSTYFRSLALLWFDDEQGFERQYAPLWSLYERSTTPDGEKRTYALWRFFQQVRTPEQTKTRIPLLFHYESDRGNDSRKMQILGGLFGFDREEDKRNLQVLYFIKIPR
jgi:hypothetical protein